MASVTPGRASILINEWVSLWDHRTIWGLGLHHSSKFLSHLRKPKLARRSLVPFHQSKALMYFPHFYPEKFYNGSQIEKKCQISLLTSQPRPFSPLQWSDLSIFQLSPAYSSIFSSRALPAQYLSTGRAILLASFSQPPMQYLLTEWEFSRYLSTKPYSMSRPWVGDALDVSPPSIIPPGRGQVTCSAAK